VGRRRYNKPRHRNKRRRRSLNATTWWPIVKLLLCVAAILAMVWALLYLALPRVARFIGVEYSPPFAPEATPSPTPIPTPSPNPVTLYDFAANTQELVFDGSSEYKWFTDPYAHGGELMISAGQMDAAGRNVVFSDMFLFHPESRSADKLPLSPENTHFMFPKFNDRWLVYLDSGMHGGGAIMAVDLTAEHMVPVKVKDIYSGQPEPMLWENYVAFTDRTGTSKDKLFVYDLNTMEAAVAAMFTGSVYGQSKPCLYADTLVWADSATSDGNSDTSILSYIALNSSTIKFVQPGTFIHDPEYNGRHIAWLTELHSSDSALYAMEGFNGEPFLIDRGVVEFGMGEGFAAYSRGEAIYAYIFDTGSIYRLTQDYESAMFLGVSGDYVMWMDVTSRERDIVKFLKIP